MAELWHRPPGETESVRVSDEFPLPVKTPVEPIEVAVGYEALTVDNTAGGVGFTAGLRRKCGQRGKVVCVLETGQIRFQVTGGAPTTTVGVPLEIGQSIEIAGEIDLIRFRAIRTGSTSGVLQCVYFRGDAS